ncbi:hypothetical protein O181_101044 [Austropuccinia psidii MF-1]|uniref:Secreted protein n=1 Tax=Austropuccinia psidii MF-1 TaxID=1389203 RepID=A0A9Q3JFS8_9BASI|nr:hypothetical protein [Austropuccinia psidii MF-1]
MSTLTHPYTSATLPNPLLCALIICLQHCHLMSALTHPYAYETPPCPHNMPQILPPNLCNHPSLGSPSLILSEAYHSYAPALDT